MPVDLIEYSAKEQAVLVTAQGKSIIFAVFEGEKVEDLVEEFKDLDRLERFSMAETYEGYKAWQDDWITVFPKEDV